jgi:hypothetical protein
MHGGRIEKILFDWDLFLPKNEVKRIRRDVVLFKKFKKHFGAFY